MKRQYSVNDFVLFPPTVRSLPDHARTPLHARSRRRSKDYVLDLDRGTTGRTHCLCSAVCCGSIPGHGAIRAAETRAPRAAPPRRAGRGLCAARAREQRRCLLRGTDARPGAVLEHAALGVLDRRRAREYKNKQQERASASPCIRICFLSVVCGERNLPARAYDV